MSPVWCSVRGRWVVRHPQRRDDIIGTGKTRDEALAEAEYAMRRARIERM